ncbi:(2Fe-2S)-binding protein [Kitasatospora sp. NPDC052868]|uniref:(2Fe-2S)-binding protein n=1 Tax=Kitasatospora sp. NPDC052868 TaxID=3364060 RepID=UPI0037C5DB0C
MTVSSTRPGPVPRAAAPAATVPTPCTASYRRIGELFPALRVRCAAPRSGDGWIPGAALLTDPDALRELIAHDARQGLVQYGRPLRPDVAAGFGLHRYCWSTALLVTLPWFLERRVPLLTPEAVSVRRRTGELTVLPDAFACLPDDPAAGLPGARTVPGEAELAARLRTALTGYLAPVLAAFRPEVRRGAHTLWAMATDAAVEGLWHVAGLLGEEVRARAELSALFAPGCAPLTPGAGFTLDTPDASGTERARASCCLVYTVRPETMCGGCPRVTRG